MNNQWIITALLMLVAVGCVKTSSPTTTRSYVKAGYHAMHSNDWHQAREHYAQAVTHAHLAALNTSDRAVVYYEYGRALGATCFYAEAEQALRRSHELCRQSHGPTFISLNELFRLNLAQGNYQEAVKYFEQSIPLMEEAKAPQNDPVEYSELLIEYSQALSALGRKHLAETMARQAQVYAAENWGMDSQNKKTPYGSQCYQ